MGCSETGTPQGSFVSTSDKAIESSSENSSFVQQNDDNNGEDYVFIRKFGTVAEFITGVRSLDTVLENIASFSTEVR